MSKQYYIFTIVAFVLIAAGIYFYSSANALIDNWALQIGNAIVALVTIFSFALISKSLTDKNPNAMVRAKMSGTILKFFTVIILVLIYLFINNRVLPHKANIFVFLGIYVVYVGIESYFLSILARSKKS